MSQSICMLFYILIHTHAIVITQLCKIMKENRAYSRVGTDVTVEVQSVPEGSGLPAGSKLVCRTRDISLIGMCIYTEMPFQPETRLLLDIELGSPARTFNLMGKVIWSRSDPDSGLYKTGIHLTNLPGDTPAWHAAVLQKLVG